jgi:hypothetical protein
MTIDDTNAAPSGEDKQWADLAAEVESEIGDEGGETGGQKADPEVQIDDAGAEKPDAEPKPAPVPYEELERRSRQTAAALKESRERERAASEQLRAFNQMVEELRARRQQPAVEEAKPDPVPDRFDDPVGYLEHQITTLQKQLETTQQATNETRQQFQQRQEYQQFMGQVSQREAEFAAVTPDYPDAAKYLEDGRRAELAILFPDSPQMDSHARQQGFQNAAHMREAVFINDAQTVARNALMAGINPAEAYYNLAKGRGYRPAAGPAPDAKMDRANNVIDATRRGAKASKTISGGGGAPDNPLNVADLTDLYAEDPEEFDKQWEKMAKAGRLG